MKAYAAFPNLETSFAHGTQGQFSGHSQIRIDYM